jgi:hypothetical protein
LRSSCYGGGHLNQSYFLLLKSSSLKLLIIWA